MGLRKAKKKARRHSSSLVGERDNAVSCLVSFARLLRGWHWGYSNCRVSNHCRSLTNEPAREPVREPGTTGVLAMALAQWMAA